MRLTSLFAVLMAFISVLSSCSDNEKSTTDKSGKEIAARFKYLLTGSMSETWLLPYSEKDNIYMAQVPDADKARIFCRKLVGDDKWDIGKDYIIPDSNGFIAANDSETDGLYVSMFFNVRGMEPLTLYITSPEYFNNHSNLGSTTAWMIYTYSCVNCGWTSSYGFLETPDKCPVCGGTTFKNHF